MVDADVARVVAFAAVALFVLAWAVLEWTSNRSLRSKENYVAWEKVEGALRVQPERFWIIRTGSRWSRVVWILPRPDPLAAFEVKTAIDMISGWVPGASVTLVPLASVLRREIERAPCFRQVSASIKRS